MIKYFLFILFIFSFNNLSAMDKKPYHHIYKDENYMLLEPP